MKKEKKWLFRINIYYLCIFRWKKFIWYKSKIFHYLFRDKKKLLIHLKGYNMPCIVKWWLFFMSWYIAVVGNNHCVKNQYSLHKNIHNHTHTFAFFTFNNFSNRNYSFRLLNFWTFNTQSLSLYWSWICSIFFFCIMTVVVFTFLAIPWKIQNYD